jgi:hypothetical protein
MFYAIVNIMLRLSYVDQFPCLVSFLTKLMLLYIDSGCVDLTGIVDYVINSSSFALFV